MLADQARAQLDALGATRTQIVVSGDLDEFAIAALAARPVDRYGAGTAVVTGSGAPTAGMVYKLVEVDGRPVAKRSEHKESHGGRKTALRAHKPTGTATEEIVSARPDAAPGPDERLLQIPLVRGGTPCRRPAEPRRLARAPAGRDSDIALGRAEALPRRAGHPHPPCPPLTPGPGQLG